MDQASEKIIDVKWKEPKEPKRKNKFVSTVKWTLFFIIFFAAAGYGLYYYINHKALLENNTKAPVKGQTHDHDEDFQTVVQKNLQAKDQEKDKLMEPPPEPQIEIDREYPKIPLTPNPEYQEIKTGMQSVNTRLDKLEMQNKNFTLYFAALELKNSSRDIDSFKRQLSFTRSVTPENSEIKSNLDLLGQAAQTGFVTKEKLIADLKVLEKNIRSGTNISVGRSVENALSELVRVSKVQGSVDKTDYQSVIRRAELNLEKPEYSSVIMKQTIEEVANLGKPAEIWIREANDYKRIQDSIEFIIEYSKSKMVE